MDTDHVERKAIYDEISRLRDELAKVAVNGCAHRAAHTSGIAVLHARIDNEKQIREMKFLEERKERIEDINEARMAREALKTEMTNKLELYKRDMLKELNANRNQILFGILVALTIAVVVGKLL